MMNVFHRTLSILVLAPWLTATAQLVAPDPEAAEEEEVPRYAVEVIIFAYAQDVAVGTERFLPGEPTAEDAEGMDAGLIAELTAPSPTPPAALHAESATPVFRPLREDELTMANVMGRIERLDVYRPLMHFGWMQTALPEAESRPLELRVFGDTPGGLDGTFTLFLSRFLHLVVDLALEAPQSRDDASEFGLPAARYGDRRMSDGTGYPGAQRPVYYRIQENRIVKNGDLRYFDHPKFGVIAKVTKIEVDDDESAPLLGRRRD